MHKFNVHSWFILLMIFYFGCRILRTTMNDLPIFLKNHFTDLLFVPVMCLFSIVILRLIRKDTSLIIPWYAVMLQTIFISYYFEYYLPNQQNNPYVGDVIDVFWYFIGALFYLILQRYNFRFFKNLHQTRKQIL